MMKRKYVIFSLIVCMGPLLLFQANADSQEIDIVGSTSVQPICEDLVEEYRKKHPDAQINVQGGGSNMAIKCVNADIADIGMCSKELNKDYNFTQYELGHEGIIVAVNPSNNVTDLSKDEIKGIFQGNITNWNQIGGENKSINVFVREQGSGTLDAFKNAIMDGSPVSDDAIVLNSQGSIKQSVEKDSSAIGILSFSYLDSDIKALAIDGVYPTNTTIANGEYMIQRPFLLLIDDDQRNETKDFIEWLGGSEAEKILMENKIVAGD